jgi:hypothetical protein
LPCGKCIAGNFLLHQENWQTSQSCQVNMNVCLLYMAKRTWKQCLPIVTNTHRLCYFHVHLNLATEHTEQKWCGKCLTCFRVTRVRWTARQAGTTGVCVWTAGTGGRKSGGATHIYRLALLCNI